MVFIKVLFVTVGGSDKPIVKSINKHKPDYVYFLATEDVGSQSGSRKTVDGEGLVCQDYSDEKRYSIVTQTDLEEKQYEITIVESDNPYSIYSRFIQLISRHIEKRDRVIADYTGGTKSMSAGLVLAAVEFPECELSIVTGNRVDLIKVKSGMERIKKLPRNAVYIQRQFHLCESLITQRNYDSAHKVLDNLSVDEYIEEQSFSRLYYLTKAFDDWDKFNYHAAAEKIDMYKKDELITPFNVLVKKLVKTVEWFENWSPQQKRNPPGSGFLLVYDLLTNAERKASHQLYDDAISRLYRAVEMYEQFCLMTSELRLNTSDLDVERLPKDLRTYYEIKSDEREKKVKISLKEGYDLLKNLDHPVGKVWGNWEKKILDILQKRNHSYLAHGNKPLLKVDYLEMKKIVWDFINECDQSMKFKEGLKEYEQLPRSL
ncbi:TIGR02710 family CRISPR-associated CARF protein [Pueribacillus theae]|uniref:TIGR02710 family CRISPR-associated CARF protein n=1 Tax=Pueribacillus theae TaxID=2171751 RepID=UPI001402343E|nr:TIGR02710 family CRISPR-associated CARF protein [Pueribacillus theae]